MTTPNRDGSSFRSRIWRTSLLASACLVATLVVTSLLSSRLFDVSLHPYLRAKAETLAETLAVQLRRSADLGIPLSKLREVDAFLDDAVAGHEEIHYIGFASPEGRLLFSSQELRRQPAGFFDRLGVAHSKEEERGLARLEGVLDLAHPVLAQGRLLGTLHLGIDAAYVEQRLQEVHIDIAIILFVTALVTLEVLMALMGQLVDRPSRLLHQLFALGAAGDFTRHVRARLHDEVTRALGAAGRRVRALNTRHAALLERVEQARRAGRLGQSTREALVSLEQRFRFGAPGASVSLEQPETGDLRLPLFVYLFGSELSRSFWPLHVKRLYEPVPFLSENILVALPMSLWVIAMVMFTPLAGRLLRTRGTRTVLLLGMAPSGLGLMMTGLASSLGELFLWRVVTASGYGIVTTAALLHVARTAKQGHSARSMGVFVGASTAASVCGTAIGGILADRIGYGETFLVAASLVGLAMVLVVLLTPDMGPRLPEDAPKPLPTAYLGILRRGRVLLFILLAAMPARLVLTGFLFFLTPLRLHELGFGEAAIGRLMMGYFITMVFATPVVSLLADQYGWHRPLMLVGGVLSGAGVLLFAMTSQSWWLLTSVVLVGLGQALTATPLLSCVPPLFVEECTWFGLDALLSVFRVIERVGSLVGPLIAAALLNASGFVISTHVIGTAMLVLTAGLAAYFFFRSPQPSTPSP